MTSPGVRYPQTSGGDARKGKLDVSAAEQLELGQALKDEGMAVADENADGWWKSTVRQTLEHLASTGRPFTADDLRDLGVPDPRSPRAWGPQFSKAARDGLIVRVGYVPSRRASVHAHPIAQWRGVAA